MVTGTLTKGGMFWWASRHGLQAYGELLHKPSRRSLLINGLTVLGLGLVGLEVAWFNFNSTRSSGLHELVLALGLASLTFMRLAVFFSKRQGTIDLEMVPLMAMWLAWPGFLTLGISLTVLAISFLWQRFSIVELPATLSGWILVSALLAAAAHVRWLFALSNGWGAVGGWLALSVVVYGMLLLGRYGQDWAMGRRRLPLSRRRIWMWFWNVGIIAGLGAGVFWGDKVNLMWWFWLSIFLIWVWLYRLSVRAMPNIQANRVVYGLTQVWQSDITAERLMQTTLELLSDNMDVDDIYAYIPKSYNDVLLVEYGWRADQPPAQRNISLHDLEWGSFLREAIRVTDITFVNKGLPAPWQQRGWHEMVLLPLKWHGVAVGVVICGRTGFGRTPWTEADTLGWQQWLPVLGNAVHTVNLIQNMTWMAFHDNLTELPNGSWLAEALAQMNVERDGVVGLCYADINNFKAYNDTYGHDYGDKVLRAVGETLQDRVKDSDIVVRLHGDEFLILVRNLQAKDNLEKIMLRLSEYVRDKPLPDPVMGHTSISIGGVYDIDLKSSLEESMRLANRAMYQCKRSLNKAPVVYERQEMEVSVAVPSNELAND